MKINEPMFLLLSGVALLALTALHPHDYPTWWMETAPIFIALPILIATYKTYAWDTQSDMLMALIGAVVAQVVLGKVQDKQLGCLPQTVRPDNQRLARLRA